MSQSVTKLTDMRYFRQTAMKPPALNRGKTYGCRNSRTADRLIG